MNKYTNFCGQVLCFEEKYEDGDIVDLSDSVMTRTCYLFVMGLVSVPFNSVTNFYCCGAHLEAVMGDSKVDYS
jgi:hypothetical protein